ncbi:hypothetical protein GGQ95_002320 [Anoxybacillus rupiensis]|nr:hypothetical protein [Anoxybacillus rupiensis]
MNKMDEIIDHVMETVTNSLFLAIVCLGIPYFFYILIQFL